MVYDILPILFPHYFPDKTDEIHQNWLNIVTQFDGIICDSQSVMNEVLMWCNSNANTQNSDLAISYFYLGCDLENSFSTSGMPQDATYVLAQMQKRPTICMVSTVEPRKGHTQVIDALEHLWKNGHNYNLVIVGKQGWHVEDLCERLRNHAELGKRLFWLEGISDEYLEAVYKNCTVALMASIGEGFGLMLIEAARYHKPLIVRDIPVFREVASEHAYYFTGTEGCELAQALQKWFKLYQEGKAPTTHGMKTLTWKESTKMLCDALFLHAHRDNQIGTQNNVKS